MSARRIPDNEGARQAATLASLGLTYGYGDVSASRGYAEADETSWNAKQPQCLRSARHRRFEDFDGSVHHLEQGFRRLIGTSQLSRKPAWPVRKPESAAEGLRCGVAQTLPLVRTAGRLGVSHGCQPSRRSEFCSCVSECVCASVSVQISAASVSLRQ